MMQLPQNRWLKGLIVTSTVAVLLCYAWLAAHLLEPSFEISPQVASAVFYRTNGHIGFFEDVASENPILSQRLVTQTESLAINFDALGAIEVPVRIIVDADKPERLSVTNDKIEIGTTVLRSQGQLKKAILKSWLLQRVSADVANSFLRIEVASDVLLAVLDGGLNLGVPGERGVLNFDSNNKAWWTFADSYQGLCKTGWKSLELSALCSAGRKEKTDDGAGDKASASGDAAVVSALSFRAFLGTQIWKSYLATPIAKREKFAKAWIASLINQDAESHARETVSATTSSVSDVRSGTSLATIRNYDWLERLQTELAVLLPTELDPLAHERASWKDSFDAPLIVIDEKGKIEAPGTLKVSANELKIRKAKMAVLTVCEAPTLADVLHLPIDADRVVWRPECSRRSNDFVQVRPSSIRLALSKKIVKPSEKLDALVMKKSDPSEIDWLGLSKARWNKSRQANQVSGAIEAVEFFRLDSKKL